MIVLAFVLIGVSMLFGVKLKWVRDSRRNDFGLVQYDGPVDYIKMRIAEGFWGGCSFLCAGVALIILLADSK